LKGLITALSGLILILGIFACTPIELPAATSAEFANLDASPSSTEQPTNLIATPPPPQTDTPTSTKTPLPNTATFTPEPTSNPTPLACWGFGGQIDERQLESEYLKKPLEYLVYLPPCYNEQPEQHYPVIFLLHGQTYRNDHWLDLGAAGITDRLMATGEISPFIMIFPYDRDQYISPPENGFGQALVLDLIPAIDQEYRTIPEQGRRAIGGISRGGNWAVHIGLQYTDLFGAIGAHSTPVFSVDTNPEIIAWIRAIPLEKMPELFVDTGENDRWLNYTLVFEQILVDEGLPHEWHLYPGYHEDAYWQAHIEEYLRWYSKGW
jgi:enterochelin esterase-like enzyme